MKAQRGKLEFGDLDHPFYGQKSPGRPAIFDMTDELLQAICREIEKGKGILAIAKMNGMPSASWIYNWSKKDRVAARAMEAARKKRPPIPRPNGIMYDEQFKDEICELLRSGMPISIVCKVEGVPNYKTVQRWRDRFPEFDDAIIEAQVYAGRNRKKKEFRFSDGMK